MKIVVIGGTALIGSKLIAVLTAQGHTAGEFAPHYGAVTESYNKAQEAARAQ